MNPKDEAGAFPQHDPMTYRVEEHEHTVARNWFVMEWLKAKYPPLGGKKHV